MQNAKVSRRKLMSWGVGAIGGLVATRSVAQICEGTTTPPQALGPFFPNEDTPVHEIREDDHPEVPLFLANDNDLTFVAGKKGTALGQQVLIKGTLQNSRCESLAGARIVVWQASESGRYNHLGDSANADFAHPVTGAVIERRHDPHFQYWGATTTSDNGEFEFKTIIPGFYPANLGSGWYRPPHIHFLISALGYPQLVTQMYFRGPEIDNAAFVEELNQKDLILQNSPPDGRENVIVDFAPDKASGLLLGQFNIKL